MITQIATLDELHTASRMFREKGNSVHEVREILDRVCGEPFTALSQVPPEKRAAVIAALEGRDIKQKPAADFITDGKLDTVAIMARFNHPRPS